MTGGQINQSIPRVPIKSALNGPKQNTESDKKTTTNLQNVPPTNGKPQEKGEKDKSGFVSNPSYSQQEQRIKAKTKNEIFLIE